jgi:glucoamylase
MPLAWTHAEFIKLMISRRLGYPVDRPSAVWERYKGIKPELTRAIWCLHAPISRLERGIGLVIALPRAATIHWGHDGWRDIRDEDTSDTGLGLHCLEIDAHHLSDAEGIDFTFQWRDSDEWTHRNFQIAIACV